MQCPKCQFENPEGIKFCGECGTKLERLCPSCNSSSPPNFKFCGECGHKLDVSNETSPKELSFDEKLAKIQKYLPKGLTKKILSQRDRIEGERKQVTVMFCDMVGFTQLSEKLGPEDAYTIMDQVYEILIHKVHDYEGTVNEMTGDGIMGLFGAPIALEDAPQRAIRSSLAIHREMTKFSEKLSREKEHIPPLKMRIGIHTGPVVVGTVGNDLRVEFKAVGDTVNLASRMEGLAEAGKTIITEDTFKLTEGFFRFEALGEKSVKGKKEPIKTYQVIALSTRRTRFEVSAERGLTPFVGRARELEILLDGFKRAKEGEGQAFSIVAEAGIGKSRLLYEFRKAMTSEDVTFLGGKCLSYSRGVAYHPVIDILKSNFDIYDDDEDNQIIEKVKKGLKILGVDETSTLPYLLELLSVKDSGVDQVQLSPEGKKDMIIAAIRRIAVRGAEIRPLIMTIEHLHWMDKSSEDVLQDMLESISGAKILLIFTYRPEFVHSWGGRSYHNHLNLNRISNRESLLMAAYPLGIEGFGKDLENLILGKTEGIPFFVEEFIKSLKELDLIENKNNKCYLKKDISGIDIPSTIQDVILARVDKLSEETKEVIQAGSVIEREFTYELIKRVTGILEQELLSHLSILKNSELLHERGIYPEVTYIFKHALTRETTYNTILKDRRKNLHAIVGKAIEDIYEENISEYYGVLVEHFIKSESYEKAAEYSRLASIKALKAAALNDAITYTEKTIFSLEKLPLTDEIQKLIIDARARLGLNFLEMNYFHEANEAIDPIIDVTLKSNYEERIPQIYTIIGTGRYCINENFKEAFEYLEKALRISKKNKDLGAFLNASYWMGYALAINCEFENALNHIEQILNFHIKANNIPNIAVMKGLISFMVYNWKGDIQTACQISQDAVLEANKINDVYPKVFAYACHGVNLFTKGHLDEAKNYLAQGLEFNKRAKQFWWNMGCNQYLGDAYYDSGEYRKAANYYLEAIHLLKSTKVYPGWLNMNQIALARANAKIDKKSINMSFLSAYAAENKLKMLAGKINRYISEIYLQYDTERTDEAEKWIIQAIKADSKNGMNWHLGKDHAIYARLCNRIGDLSKAQENLVTAIEIFKECGADGWVEKYEKELAEL